MKKHPTSHQWSKRQEGVVLVVSLMLLVVITLLSITAMRSANLDTKIAINYQHKQLAFQAAENAFARLTSLPPQQMQNLNVPGVKNVVANNMDFIPTDPSAKNSSDLDMQLVDISKPGQYKFSGYGLNIVTVIYQADAEGEVDGTNATVHNRMQVALIRE